MNGEWTQIGVAGARKGMKEEAPNTSAAASKNASIL
jgi:hypothetical protein